jgi:hypothetical protein
MIDSPTGVVLLGSNRNRISSTGRGRCSYSRKINMSAWIGASISVMSLFTTVIAPTISLLRVLGSLGSLNTLIPSHMRLEVVGALNHLTLWGRESLSSCLQPWLKLRLSRMEHRSSCGRSNMGPGATARLMLMHELTVVLNHSSVILQHKGLVHHPLEVLKISGLQSIGQPIIQVVQETLMFLLISVDFIQGIMRQLSELGDVLIHRHGPLFQTLNLLLLWLDNSLGNKMCTESGSELRPADALRFLMGFHVSIPPVSCRTRMLQRG